VLHEFGNGSDGTDPNGGLVIDAVGNVYGTTEGGGIYTCNGFVNSCGAVFELSPSGSGWTETVLYSFNGTDGYQPRAGLVMDAAGNLYGIAFQGGNVTGQNCAPFGCGSMFEMSPNAGGGWTESALYNFNNQPDGALPAATLILDPVGNLYGTTSLGGSGGEGTVFEVSPRGGEWNETVLLSFDGVNGGLPATGVIRDRLGNLYGTTGLGGLYYAGQVFELTSPTIRLAP
jgi:uncharacterized repeat protein (TIGR03803 family)